MGGEFTGRKGSSLQKQQLLERRRPSGWGPVVPAPSLSLLWFSYSVLVVASGDDPLSVVHHH